MGLKPHLFISTVIFNLDFPFSLRDRRKGGFYLLLGPSVGKKLFIRTWGSSWRFLPLRIETETVIYAVDSHRPRSIVWLYILFSLFFVDVRFPHTLLCVKVAFWACEGCFLFINAYSFWVVFHLFSFWEFPLSRVCFPRLPVKLASCELMRLTYISRLSSFTK